MHKLCLLTIVALAQTANGQGFGDAPPDGVLAEFAPQPSSAAPPTTHPHAAESAIANNQAAPLPNVGQQLGETYVVPASATTTQTSDAVETPLPMSAHEPLRLSQQRDSTGGTSEGPKAPPSVSGTIVKIVSSLAIVLGLFFLSAWFIKRGSGGAGGALPSDVVQVLGRSQLSNKQQLQLIRLGSKLVLVAISPSGVQTLTEVTNPAEVERLATACEGTRSGSASESFRQVLSQLGNQPAIGGFFGGDQTAARQRRSRNAEDSHV